MTDSEIVHGPGGITFAGPDAVALYRAIVLHSALRMYSKSRMQPNRAWTPTVMLNMAEGITGKRYKRGQYDQACADLTLWIDEMKLAMPVRSEP